jgi:hypothetical protein
MPDRLLAIMKIEVSEQAVCPVRPRLDDLFRDASSK